MILDRYKEETMLSKKEQLLNLLGLAQRAGKLISGEELVLKAIQTGEAQLVFLANDAAANLTKKMTDKSKYYNRDVSTAFNTLELSASIGKSRKVIAVCDAGFSKKMRTLMD